MPVQPRPTLTLPAGACYLLVNRKVAHPVPHFLEGRVAEHVFQVLQSALT
eukprot:COSAG05_NODE_21161_length_274_cov_0.582857_1_plen_49_part_10